MQRVGGRCGFIRLEVLADRRLRPRPTGRGRAAVLGIDKDAGRALAGLADARDARLRVGRRSESVAMSFITASRAAGGERLAERGGEVQLVVLDRFPGRVLQRLGRDGVVERVDAAVGQFLRRAVEDELVVAELERAAGERLEGGDEAGVAFSSISAYTFRRAGSAGAFSPFNASMISGGTGSTAAGEVGAPARRVRSGRVAADPCERERCHPRRQEQQDDRGDAAAGRRFTAHRTPSLLEPLSARTRGEMFQNLTARRGRIPSPLPSSPSTAVRGGNRRFDDPLSHLAVRRATIPGRASPGRAQGRGRSVISRGQLLDLLGRVEVRACTSRA